MHIGDVYVGVFFYTYNLILLASIGYVFQKMINICEVYAVEFKISLNETKSKLIVRKCDLGTCGEDVEGVNRMDYLSHSITNDRSDSASKDFNIKFNSFISKISFM